ncbi:hypothetical protein J6590_010766 [Homalodisca vitripennis]|nr:hypothetical protein J6590_010766 [Homalodisca vitripennis]
MVQRTRTAIESVAPDVLINVREEIKVRLNVCMAIHGAHVEPKYTDILGPIIYLKPVCERSSTSKTIARCINIGVTLYRSRILGPRRSPISNDKPGVGERSSTSTRLLARPATATAPEPCPQYIDCDSDALAHAETVNLLHYPAAGVGERSSTSTRLLARPATATAPEPCPQYIDCDSDALAHAETVNLLHYPAAGVGERSSTSTRLLARPATATAPEPCPQYIDCDSDALAHAETVNLLHYPAAGLLLRQHQSHVRSILIVTVTHWHTLRLSTYFIIPLPLYRYSITDPGTTSITYITNDKPGVGERSSTSTRLLARPATATAPEPCPQYIDCDSDALAHAETVNLLQHYPAAGET